LDRQKHHDVLQIVVRFQLCAKTFKVEVYMLSLASGKRELDSVTLEHKNKKSAHDLQRSMQMISFVYCRCTTSCLCRVCSPSGTHVVSSGFERGPYLSQLAQSSKAMRQRACECMLCSLVDHELHHSLCCITSSILYPFLPITHTHDLAAMPFPPLSLRAYAAILQH